MWHVPAVGSNSNGPSSQAKEQPGQVQQPSLQKQCLPGLGKIVSKGGQQQQQQQMRRSTELQHSRDRQQGGKGADVPDKSKLQAPALRDKGAQGAQQPLQRGNSQPEQYSVRQPASRQVGRYGAHVPAARSNGQQLQQPPPAQVGRQQPPSTAPLAVSSRTATGGPSAAVHGAAGVGGQLKLVKPAAAKAPEQPRWKV